MRDKGGPRLLGQLLMAPMLDDRNNSASALQMDGIEFWNRGHNGFGWSSLLGDARGGADVPQYAAPARAIDLAGLPPAFLDVGSACATRSSPTPTGYGRPAARPSCVWPGAIHAFDRDDPEARISKAAVAARRNWLERLLATD